MKVLLVTSRFPLPSWRGNQLRTIQWIEALAGHERHLICPAGDQDILPPGLETELERLPEGGGASVFGILRGLPAGKPAQEGLYASAAARSKVLELVADWRPHVAVIQMVRCGWAVDAIRAVDPELPLIFDAIDCMALHYRRAMDFVGLLLRPAYAFEARRCRRRETELVSHATLTTAVSGRDLRALGAGVNGRVVTVSAGIEADHTDQTVDEPVIVLSGNLGYRPTVRAANWFADRVWPRIHDRVPSARWILAGARPASAVRRLETRPGIEVHGDVDDIRPFLLRATAAIAPMASGSGVPIKILEAMAAGVPVVADPWSADGLEDRSAVAVAANEPGWVDILGRFLTRPEAAQQQAEKGSAIWRSHYRPSRVREQIHNAVTMAAGRTP